MFRSALSKGLLPASMRKSLITVIHKKGKDPQQCGSYRPISSGNVDGKILTKILSNRLDGILTTIIHQDQVGFIRGRSSADNLRRLLHILWGNRDSPDPVMAFSLDAEKAFDRVEWGFLFYTLNKFGVGPSFLAWVKLLYVDPMVSLL